MRKKSLLFLTLLPLLSSCSLPNGMIKKVKDVSKLYIGAYPTARIQETGKDCDQYLYISFCDTNELTDSSIKPDITVNLNNKFLESFDSGQRYYDVAKGYEELTGESLQGWLSKHFVMFYTGIGSPEEKPQFLSAPEFTRREGSIISLSTIQYKYEKLSMTFADCYKEELEWRFWLW